MSFEASALPSAREVPFVDRVGRVLILAVDEEEEFVLQNRSAEGDAVDVALLALTLAEELATHLVATQILVLEEGIGGATEGIGSLLGHHVDRSPHEITVFHVEGRGDDLHLLERVDRDGTVVCWQTTTVETHVEVEVGTIDAVVVHALVTSAKGIAHEIWRETCDVVYPSFYGRCLLYLVGHDVLRSSSLHFPCILSLHFYLSELVAIGQVEMTFINLAELETTEIGSGLIVSHIGGFNVIGASSAKSFKTIGTLLIDDCGITCARRGVDSGNHCTRQHALAISSCSGNT